MVSLEVFPMGAQESDGLFEQRTVGRCPQIVVGPGQLAVHLRGALLGWNGLQRVNDLLVLALFIPLLALP